MHMIQIKLTDNWEKYKLSGYGQQNTAKGKKIILSQQLILNQFKLTVTSASIELCSLLNALVAAALDCC